MQFNIICIGKCKDKNIIDLYENYVKRIKPYAKIKLIELPHGKGSVSQIKQTEAESILKRLSNNSFVISLDEKGQSLSTVQFAEIIKKQTITGYSEFCLIIGGAEGLSDSIRKKSHLILSLSALTYPHMLVRVVLIEQLYRIITVINNHPYHREG